MSFWSIRKQLFLLFLVVSLTPVIVVSVSSYRSYTKLVDNQVSSLATQTIESSVERIGAIMRDLDRITLTFQQFSARPGSATVADQLNELNRKADLSLYDLFLARQNMMFFFNNLMLSNDYIRGIYLFLPSGHSISYSHSNDLAVGYVPFADEWYQETLRKRGGLYISEIGQKDFFIDRSTSITFSRALYDTNTREMLGVIMLDCDLAIFQELDKEIVPDVTTIYLADRNGVILYENSMTLIGQRLPDPYMDLVHLNADDTVLKRSDGKLIVIRPFSGYNWLIMASIDIRKLYEQYGISEQLIVYISLTCAAIFVALSVVLSRIFTKPIIELANIMRTSKLNPLAPTNKHQDRKDEIGILFTEYNKMIHVLDEYIRESYQNKLMTLDAQMKALEAQINSHFLYNTLESINSIAEIEGVESISIMTKALGDMFRYSIKTDSELVTVAEELNHVNNYMAIQKIRYEGRIDFQVRIGNELLNQRILKLILQPIVENAVYHGIERSAKGGTVVLNAFLDRDTDTLVFEIRDDGVGMTPEQLHEVRALLAQPPEFKELGQRNKRGIGLKNVHSRIALYYGENYGLTVASRKDAGTTITVKVPRTVQR